MKTTPPMASLIMPNYNYGEYLNEALDSVVSQTYSDFELILIDDASTDNSLEIIKPYLKHPFIRLIRHKENQGFFKSIEEGLLLARGKYIAFPSSDDLLFPKFLEKKIEILETHDDVGLCFSKAATFQSGEPEQLQGAFSINTLHEIKLNREELIHQIKMYRLSIPGNATLSRKELFIKHGGYDPQYHSLTDWFVFLKIAFSHGAYFLPETLGALRVHGKSLSHTEDLSSKKQTWGNIFSCLSKKENRSLKQAFIRSHIFNTFGTPFFEFILKNPKYWPFFKLYVYKHFYKKLKQNKKK